MSLDSFFATMTSSRAVISDSDNPSLYNSGDKDAEASKNYQWQGAKLTSNVGDAIPIVYGRHQLAGNVINAYVETGDTDTLNMLIGLCEGPISSVSNCKVNGVAVENLYGVAANDPYGENAEITYRKGEQVQNVIREFGDIHSPVSLSVTLIQNQSHIYETDGSSVMAFKLGAYTNKLYKQDADGNKTSWYYALKIEHRVKGTTDWTLDGAFESNATTETQTKRYFKSEYLPPAKYEIRITKLSEDENNETKFGQVTVFEIDEITNYELSYPYVALLGVRLVATDKISGSMPNITVEVEGRTIRIPDVQYGGSSIDWEDYYYDATTSQFKRLDNDAVCTWDSVTYREAFSANPVWCLRDLYTNSRYGLGQFISEDAIDAESFLSAALYCDEGVDNVYGKKEKRARLDIVLDSSERALNLVQQITSIFRGLPCYSNGRVRLLIEKADAVSQVFSMANIIAGSFNILYHSSKDIPNVLVMDYTNKDKDYSRDSIEIADENSLYVLGNAVRQAKISSFGCTRSSQLLREGKVLLNKVKMNTRSISFEAFTDSLACQAGDIILFQHDVPQWSYSTRCAVGCTNSLIKLAKSITLEPLKTYQIAIRNGLTDALETRTISTPQGTVTQVNVSSPFSFIPAKGDIWVIGEQDKVGVTYRITGLTRKMNGKTSISAVQYTKEAYDASSIVMPDDNYTYITLEIPQVYNLKAKEKVTRLLDGTIMDTIQVNFSKPPNGLRWVKKAVKFHIMYSSDGGKTWVNAGSTDGEDFTITDPLIIGGKYTVAVVSEADTGDKNAPATSPQQTVTIEGWQSPASPVTGYIYSFSNVIELSWDESPDVDVFGYEIRTEDADWGQDDAELVWRGNAVKYVVQNPIARTGIPYYIKAVNTTGKYSTSAAVVMPVNPPPDAPILSATGLFQKTFLLWQNVMDADVKHYEVWRNDNENWIGIPQGNEFIVSEVVGTSAVLEVPYQRTYFRIRAVDGIGGGYWSNTVFVDMVLLGQSDISPESISETHLMANSVTASKIIAASVQAYHISTKQVLAEHIDVSHLSAVSSNLGTIVAGSITGATIKSSDFLYRVEMNQGGFFAYDENGVVRTKLTRGSLCLIDPLNSDFYSYLDSGALKFHYPQGTTPYVKRIKSGNANAGSTVWLQHWYEQPEVNVSINRLSSFKAASIESDQHWCVYADNVRKYCNDSFDFGWAFDVHSKLVISGGIRNECIWLCEFDQSISTIANVCEVIIKPMFQLYTHGQAPSNYCYGVECYEIRYKLTGTGVWSSYQHTYTQPSSSADLMRCTQIMCHTLLFANPGSYDLQLHRVALNWYDSGIPSGSIACCLCCYKYTVDNSYWGWRYGTTAFGAPDLSVSNPNFGTQKSGAVGFQPNPNFPADYVHYQTAVSYYGQAANAGYDPSYQSWGSINPGFYMAGKSGGCYVSWIGGPIASLSGTTANWYRAGGWWTNIKATGISGAYYWKQCCKICALACCTCCYYYEVPIGEPATVTYEKLYSTQDVTSEEEILDGAGVVNYFAIAYA